MINKKALINIPVDALQILLLRVCVFYQWSLYDAHPE